jgi:hypothetical protein
MSLTTKKDCSQYLCNNCYACPTGCESCEATDGCNQFNTCQNKSGIRQPGRGVPQVGTQARYGVNNSPLTSTGKYRTCKFSCRHYDEVMRDCPCWQRPRICCKPEKPISDVGLVRGGSSNPADITSFGFTKNYDGRIRGGIKTREAFYRPKRGYAYNIISRNF